MKQETRIVFLAALGGMLELYDFVIYGMFAIYFAHQFFPHVNSLVSTLDGYMVFTLGYLARPFGGIVFSTIGDTYGRKIALILTMLMMGISSIGIGILPTYAQIGASAPIILLGLRLLQGIALGGELPSAFVYLSETMPSNKFILSFALLMAGVNTGSLLGIVFNKILTATLSETTLYSVGWRLPFIFGGAICIISYKIRKNINEALEFTQIKTHAKFPLLKLLKHHTKALCLSIGIVASMAAMGMIAIIFMPTYLHQILHIPLTIVSNLMVYIGLINVSGLIIIGITFRDCTIDLRRLYCYGLALAVILTILAYFLMANGILHSQPIFYIGIISIGALNSVVAALAPAIIPKLFPTQVRLSGVALAYNISYALFSSALPIMITSLANKGFDVYLVPAMLLVGIFALSIVSLTVIKRTHSACFDDLM